MKAPGNARREGISLLELAEMFPDEDAARKWWEGIVWPRGRHCPRCGSTRTHEASHAKCPYRCTDCRSYFSAKTGTVIEGSKLPFRTWAFAIHLETASPKGVSSMKLHRDLGISQKSAWFMLHRIREVWRDDAAARLAGPVEADEADVGGKRRNMPKSRRKELGGRGAVGKVAARGA
ncbi:MAG: IS1595 family transposase [Dehalococcoidia bacterium]|nr:IS1595 family transposase [Dehalococcoidia bacterium]